jgi:hypothetical protein
LSYTIDANILLYASNEASPRSEHSRAFLDRAARETELLYLFWPTVFAYLRIATHPSVFERPLTPAEAIANIEELLRLPQVQTTGERGGFWPSYQRVAADADARGNLVSDAHLVALMVENGVRTIWTNDRDYRRFEAIDARDPFDPQPE